MESKYKEGKDDFELKKTDIQDHFIDLKIKKTESKEVLFKNKLLS